MKKGTKHTTETRKKIKEARKRQTNFGNEKKLGKHYSPTTEFKKGQLPWNKGKLGFRKGHKVSKETRRRIGEAQIGEKNHMYGKKHTESCKIKMRKMNSEENHWNWKGGISGKNRLKYLEKLAGRPRPEKCEICNRIHRICFDHDHRTGKFRGWICFKCNAAIGLLDDSTELLNSLLKYLKQHEQ